MTAILPSLVGFSKDVDLLIKSAQGALEFAVRFVIPNLNIVPHFVFILIRIIVRLIGMNNGWFSILHLHSCRSVQPNGSAVVNFEIAFYIALLYSFGKCGLLV